MAKQVKKTYWEARWTQDREEHTKVFDEHKNNEFNEAACRIFAQQKAFDLGLTNHAVAYTTVRCYEVELAEEYLGEYNRVTVIKNNAPERITSAPADI